MQKIDATINISKNLQRDKDNNLYYFLDCGLVYNITKKELMFIRSQPQGSIMMWKFPELLPMNSPKDTPFKENSHSLYIVYTIQFDKIDTLKENLKWLNKQQMYHTPFTTTLAELGTYIKSAQNISEGQFGNRNEVVDFCFSNVNFEIFETLRKEKLEK